MVSGGMKCVKYLLFCFNLLFVISGLAILTVGILIQSAYYHYGDFVDKNLLTPPMILIAVGIIVLLIAFFGCCGAANENRCMINTFAVLLVILFALEVTAGILGYTRKDDVEGGLKKRLNGTMEEYLTNAEIQKSWNILQHDFNCCGIGGPSDWKVVFKNDTLPYTCCSNITKDSPTPCTLQSDTVTKEGCLNYLKNWVDVNAHFLGLVAIGIGLIQLVGLMFACCLARSIREEYETV